MLYTEPSSYGVGGRQSPERCHPPNPRLCRRAVPQFAVGRGDQLAQWRTAYRQFLPGARMRGWARDPSEQVVMPRATLPIPEVATNATLLANVSEQPDSDGVFRRASQFRVFDGKAVPSLGLAAYLAAEKTAGRTPPLELKPGWLKIGEREVPIDGRGRDRAAFLRKERRPRFLQRGSRNPVRASAAGRREACAGPGGLHQRLRVLWPERPRAARCSPHASEPRLPRRRDSRNFPGQPAAPFLHAGGAGGGRCLGHLVSGLVEWRRGRR